MAFGIPPTPSADTTDGAGKLPHATLARTPSADSEAADTEAAQAPPPPPPPPPGVAVVTTLRSYFLGDVTSRRVRGGLVRLG